MQIPTVSQDIWALRCDESLLRAIRLRFPSSCILVFKDVCELLGHACATHADPNVIVVRISDDEDLVLEQICDQIPKAIVVGLALRRGLRSRMQVTCIAATGSTAHVPGYDDGMWLTLPAFAANERSAGAEPDMLNAIARYASTRRLSARQKFILQLHVRGSHDKDIASALEVSTATVYEHWRRMACKTAGKTKSDVLADFHRFLGTGTRIVFGRPELEQQERFGTEGISA